MCGMLWYAISETVPPWCSIRRPFHVKLCTIWTSRSWYRTVSCKIYISTIWTSSVSCNLYIVFEHVATVLEVKPSIQCACYRVVGLTVDRVMGTNASIPLTRSNLSYLFFADIIPFLR